MYIPYARIGIDIGWHVNDVHPVRATRALGLSKPGQREWSIPPRSMGVATGGSNLEELTAAGADVVLADLTNVDALREVIVACVTAEG